MNLPSMEVIFLALSGVILMAGILYWFWIHIQQTQKKVQLLENAVFELRGLVSPGPGPGPGSGPGPSPAAPPAPAVYQDLHDEEDWDADVKQVSTSLANLPAPVQTIHEVEPAANTVHVIRESAAPPAPVPEDLMPGGGSHVAPVAAQEESERTIDLRALVKEEEQFRELFISPSPAGGAAESVSSNAEALESMPVKELRRLAEQRGIAGVADMNKKKILAALRQQITPALAHQVEVERTMDLADIVSDQIPSME